MTNNYSTKDQRLNSSNKMAMSLIGKKLGINAPNKLALIDGDNAFKQALQDLINYYNSNEYSRRLRQAGIDPSLKESLINRNQSVNHGYVTKEEAQDSMSRLSASNVSKSFRAITNYNDGWKIGNRTIGPGIYFNLNQLNGDMYGTWYHELSHWSDRALGKKAKDWNHNLIEGNLREGVDPYYAKDSEIRARAMSILLHWTNNKSRYGNDWNKFLEDNKNNQSIRELENTFKDRQSFDNYMMNFVSNNTPSVNLNNIRFVKVGGVILKAQGGTQFKKTPEGLSLYRYLKDTSTHFQDDIPNAPAYWLNAGESVLLPDEKFLWNDPKEESRNQNEISLQILREHHPELTDDDIELLRRRYDNTNVYRFDLNSESADGYSLPWDTTSIYMSNRLLDYGNIMDTFNHEIGHNTRQSIANSSLENIDEYGMSDEENEIFDKISPFINYEDPDYDIKAERQSIPRELRSITSRVGTSNTPEKVKNITREELQDITDNMPTRRYFEEVLSKMAYFNELSAYDLDAYSEFLNLQKRIEYLFESCDNYDSINPLLENIKLKDPEAYYEIMKLYDGGDIDSLKLAILDYGDKLNTLSKDMLYQKSEYKIEPMVQDFKNAQMNIASNISPKSQNELDLVGLARNGSKLIQKGLGGLKALFRAYKKIIPAMFKKARDFDGACKLPRGIQGNFAVLSSPKYTKTLYENPEIIDQIPIYDFSEYSPEEVQQFAELWSKYASMGPYTKKDALLQYAKPGISEKALAELFEGARETERLRLIAYRYGLYLGNYYNRHYEELMQDPVWKSILDESPLYMGDIVSYTLNNRGMSKEDFVKQLIKRANSYRRFMNRDVSKEQWRTYAGQSADPSYKTIHVEGQYPSGDYGYFAAYFLGLPELTGPIETWWSLRVPLGVTVSRGMHSYSPYTSLFGNKYQDVFRRTGNRDVSFIPIDKALALGYKSTGAPWKFYDNPVHLIFQGNGQLPNFEVYTLGAPEGFMWGRGYKKGGKL